MLALHPLTIPGLGAKGGSTPASITVPGLGPSALPMELHAGITPALGRLGRDRFPLLLSTRVKVQLGAW